MKRRFGGFGSGSSGLGLVAALGVALAGACGAPENGEEIERTTSALTGQDVMGFESLDAWTPQSGTEALTTNHTQGAFAYALTAPVNFTFINSAAVESTTPNLQGLATAGSSFAIDFIIPPQQPNPFFFGSLQLLVTVPSRAVNNLFLGQVELTGLPTGVFQTLRFPIPDSLRNALRGQTFTDLTFSLALNAPSGATGTYVFDNLRVVAANNADFTLTPNPANVTVTQGATATSTIAIARVGGFAAGVAFTASGLPAGVTATFNPATTTGNSTVVTFTAAANATVGPATVIITGTGGGLSRTTTINLTVNAGANFTLAPNPANVTVVQGATATSTITIARTGGFVASVAFSATGLPAGVTATFTPAATTGNTTVVTFTAAANAAVGGPTPVTITGVGGGLTRTTTINLTVAPAPNFTLTAAPANVTVVQGATATSTISITRIGGFVASVAFTATGLPAGVTATFNPAATTGNTTVVTFTAAANAAVGGPTPITITGVGGGLTRTTTINLTVAAAPDFALAATPAAVTVVQGSTADSTITVIRLNGFVASVAFSATGLPAGVTATFNPAATAGNTSVVTFTAALNAATGPAVVTITGVGGGLTRTTTINLTVAPAPDFALAADPAAVSVPVGGSASSTVAVIRLNGFAASVAFSATGLPAGVTATFNPAATAGTSTIVTFTAADTAPLGSAAVTITGVGGGLTRTTTIQVTVVPAGGDFTLTASPQGIQLVQGQTAFSFIDIHRIDGFASTVTFSITGLPAGVTATFTPPATAGDSTTLALSATPTATLGFGSLVVTATGGGLVRTIVLDLFVLEPPVPDFVLAASPSSLALTQGQSVSASIAIMRINGFAGAVDFSINGLSAGLTATFDPASASGDSTTLTLTASPTAVTGFSTIVVTGVSGGLTRSTNVSLFVNEPVGGDFTIAASPSGIALTQGESAFSFISINRLDGFANTVTFSATGLPDGVTATFTPPSTAGDSTTLTLTASATATPGFATVIVTGTGGGLSRDVAISIFIDAAVPPDFVLSANPPSHNLVAGESVLSLISIVRTNFTGDVSFSATGLPPGVTATFDPPSAGGDFTLVTFTAAADAPSSFADVVVTGTGGGLTRTTTVSLFVSGAVVVP